MLEPGILVRRSAVFRYGVAAVAVAAATAVRLALEPLLGLYSPYLPFTLAVIVASRFGGRGPGLAATALSVGAVYYVFFEPRYTPWLSDPTVLPGLALFAAIGTTISFLVGQLRESLISSALNEERLRLAQTKAQVGIWDRNPRTGETTFTPELERAYGLDPGTIKTYEDWRRRVHPDDIGRIEAERDEALARHEPFEFEFRVFHSSGEVRWFSASGGGIYDQAGSFVRVLGVNIDITDRKRLEDQFRQAQKLEGIGRLAGGVAHDFNNLLTVISGYAQAIFDDLAVQHPLREPTEQILKAAARATNLTRQLLLFSRRRVSEPRNIVLNDLVRDFEKMLRRLIGEEIHLVLSLDPGAGVLRADAGQIEQVLLNLAVNAKDAMPTGGTLSIETSSLLADEEFSEKHLSVKPGLYVVLVVSDTGIGMSPEVKSHLFEPFFTTKEAGKGTGLGLSTVYGIVKQSEGSIWVYSEPGRGTAFRMLFPAVEAEGEPAPPTPAKVFTGNETILLAEDEPDVRDFVRRVLERHGYTVLEASNGREALELARLHKGPIHLVMADVVMPEMGGAEFADQFGAEHPGIPVLFMSGYANHLALPEGVGAGYLQKPFTSASLLTQVRAVLDARPEAS